MKQKTLLLSCCAPCSCAVIEKMVQSKKDFSVLFYNPNIKPFSEYEHRLEENKNICNLYNVPFIDLEYDDALWNKLTKGLENEPERGSRCSVCFYMRLRRAMEYAKENGFSTVSSVLGASRYKDLDQVNKIAHKAAAQLGLIYTEIELRKNGMQERAANLTKELGLYHQNYCGCKPRKA